MVNEVANEASWSLDSTQDISQSIEDLNQQLQDLDERDAAAQSAEAPEAPSSGSKFTTFVAEQGVGAGMGYAAAVGLAAVGAGAMAPVVGATITAASVAKGVSSLASSADGKKKRTTRPSAMTSTPSKAAIQAQMRMTSGSAPKSSIFVNSSKLKAAGRKGDLFAKMAVTSSTTANAGPLKAKKAPKPVSYAERQKIIYKRDRLIRMENMGPMIIAGEDAMGPRAQHDIRNNRNQDVVMDRVMDYSSAMSKPTAPKPPTAGATA